MEGMSFESPKGKMTFRKEDHQAMQSMYHFKIKVDPAFAWGVPELVREINRTKALIVVEHDMQFIRMIARQVTVFNQGSVLVEDTVESIMRNPQVRDIYLGKQAAA